MHATPCYTLYHLPLLTDEFYSQLTLKQVAPHRWKGDSLQSLDQLVSVSAISVLCHLLLVLAQCGARIVLRVGRAKGCSRNYRAFEKFEYMPVTSAITPLTYLFAAWKPARFVALASAFHIHHAAIALGRE